MQPNELDGMLRRMGGITKYEWRREVILRVARDRGWAQIRAYFYGVLSALAVVAVWAAL